MSDKEKLRKKIARDTEEFLARGGVIEVVPAQHFCPKSMQWARDRGLDYTPWNVYGDPIAMSKDGYERLGDNNYYRPPAPTEE
jgi:hypothetical protein